MAKNEISRIEGYYLGYKTVENMGLNNHIYILLTRNGRVGVQEKFNLHRYLKLLSPGQLIRISLLKNSFLVAYDPMYKLTKKQLPVVKYKPRKIKKWVDLSQR